MEDESGRLDNSFHVVVVSDEFKSTVLDGFIIRGGYVTPSDPSETSFGGGLVASTYGRIANLRLDSNLAEYGGGAAIYGVYWQSRIENLTFVGNAATGNGGGLWFYTIDSPGLRHLTFTDNRAGHDGGGMAVSAGVRGAIEIFDSRFSGNAAASIGGGFSSLGLRVTLVNASFFGNSADRGGGLGVQDRSFLLINGLFSGNRSSSTGGAVYERSVVSRFVNTTIAYNRTDGPGGGVYADGSPTRLDNSIIWGNSAVGGGDQLYAWNEPVYEPPYVLSYVFLDGFLPEGAEASGPVQDTDPLFSNPTGADGLSGSPDDDLTLKADSPAIDAGSDLLIPLDSLDVDQDHESHELFPFDLAFRDRFYDGGSGAPTIDAGAYEFGAPAIGLERKSATEPSEWALHVLSNYPNPFGERTTVSFTTGRAQVVSLEVFDALGRRLRHLVLGDFLPGEHRVVVSSKGLSAGVYFYALSSGNDRTAGRMIIVR
jgi:hypothetical protein